jgi:hypothetical protein
VLKNTGHWVLEERPEQTAEAPEDFLGLSRQGDGAALPATRLSAGIALWKSKCIV